MFEKIRQKLRIFSSRFAEYFSGEALQICAVPPRVRGESCFPASFIKKSFPIPAVVHRYLR